MCMKLFWWDEFSFWVQLSKVGIHNSISLFHQLHFQEVILTVEMYSQINTYDTFGHIIFINWSVSLHSQLQDNKTTSIPPHLSLHPISRYLSPMEQDKSASLSVLLYYDNWSVAGFVVLRTAISLSDQHNRTHKLPHATAAGLFRVHGLTLLVEPCSTTTANRSSVSPRVLQHFCHPQISVSLSGVRAAIIHHLTEKEQL